MTSPLQPQGQGSYTVDASAYLNAPATPQPPKDLMRQHAASGSSDLFEEKVKESTAAVVDPQPALHGMGPEFVAANSEPEGVDLTTMPSFRDMRRMLPSERLRVQMKAAKVAAALPAHLKEAEGVEFEALSPEDLDALTDVIATVESVVLDNAADREAMTDWLVDQKEPLDAVITAFTEFTSRLGE